MVDEEHLKNTSTYYFKVDSLLQTALFNVLRSCIVCKITFFCDTETKIN